MVVLTRMPNEAVISGFKGVVDFYYYMGLQVARRWPRSPGKRRATKVEDQWSAWTWVSKNWNNLSPEVQDAYRQTATGSRLTGRDLFMKSFISSYFREGLFD